MPTTCQLTVSSRYRDRTIELGRLGSYQSHPITRDGSSIGLRFMRLCTYNTRHKSIIEWHAYLIYITHDHNCRINACLYLLIIM